MADELKTYKVLKRLGWGGGTYMPNDMVEMLPNWAAYYIKEKVIEPTVEQATTTAIEPEEPPTDSIERRKTK